MGTIYTALKFWQDMAEGGAVIETGEAMLSYNEDLNIILRRQLMDGRAKTGQLITPSYFNDPFFKTPEAAKQYSDWKDKISPSSNRPSGTPNLFINGRFHNSLYLVVTGDLYDFLSQDPNALEIKTTFSDAVGLSPESRLAAWQNFLRHEVAERIKQKQLA